ncbi:MAG: glyoxylase-like metal-dependent hydrolase (beta-lactamase superfamily II) [Gammaproteobacteria bacterium]|jgi:glyoxylase-like metal-dependent hydrolase (beta-lactamase superfamily II)
MNNLTHSLQKIGYPAVIAACLLTITSVQAWTLPVGEFSFEAINDQVYVMHGPLEEPNIENHGFMNNPAIIIDEIGIILVDPGSSLQVGQQVLAEIKKISTRPVIAVFNSHIHGDHFLANHAIRNQFPAAKIYGHREMIKQVPTEGHSWISLMSNLTGGLSDGTELVGPTEALEDGMEITIGQQRFKFHSRLPSHTNTDIVIEHLNSKTVFLGDNGFNQRMGRFDSSASIFGNINILEALLERDIEWIVPGHGMSGTKPDVLMPWLNYLYKLRDVVEAGFEEGLEAYEIKQESNQIFKHYESWVGFKSNFGKHLSQMYLEVEQVAW